MQMQREKALPFAFISSFSNEVSLSPFTHKLSTKLRADRSPTSFAPGTWGKGGLLERQNHRTETSPAWVVCLLHRLEVPLCVCVCTCVCIYMEEHTYILTYMLFVCMHTYIYTVHTYTQLYIFSYYYYYYLFYWCSSIVVYIMASSECKKGAVNKGNKKRRGKEKERRA